MKKRVFFKSLDELSKKSFVVETGFDDLRVKFVNIQGCVEHVLACSQAMGEITTLIGAIHTPTPATPFCIKPDGTITDNLIDPSVRYDIDKFLTVKSRAQIAREFLIKGGKLFIVYPQGGLEKRTAEQQQIYFSELETYKDHLFNWVLNCSELNPHMNGATYLFRNKDREVFAFSIKSTQTNDTSRETEWGVWLVAIEDSAVATRVNLIFDYLTSCDGPDLRTML